ncbi:uncharacterized protein LOC563420 [Danio rerio]|uniref:Si:ch211-245h14.1 n=1 Tax=Danio rerio TaxID=7955 RepID=F1QXH6_DANRE|nr:uncharacterized protein LOC563420 [Danio rerio]|eukprot:NP_001313398.1 uncharacterized protein LOC563420 [Danio rerio]
MNNAGSSTWLPPAFAWINPKTWGSNKEKNARAVREEINLISGSSVLDEAGIDDAQVLTLTREDLNELFPGIKNFQLRRTIMAIITESVKDSSGPQTFDAALKQLMAHNSNDPAVHEVVKESLRAFREVDQQLKSAQASLKPYIDILSSLSEAPSRKEDWETERTSSRKKLPSPSHTSSRSSIKKKTYEPSVKVHLLLCGRTLGAHTQVLAGLPGVQASELMDCQLILAFCPVVSRVGTDIEEALKKIPVDKPAVLVMMYHTFNPNHICQNLHMSTSQANIMEYVNVLFHDSHNGILNCPANDQAMTKLQMILNQYMS